MKDFVRIAAAVPVVRPGKIADNVAAIKKLIDDAHKQGVQLIAFPELSMTVETCGDVFFLPEFLSQSENAIL